MHILSVDISNIRLYAQNIFSVKFSDPFIFIILLLIIIMASGPLVFPCYFHLTLCSFT